MSCVIGIINKDGVWIGADSAATTEEGERRPIFTKKIFRNGEYLLGCTGSIRGSQLLYPEHFTPPKQIHFLPDEIRKHFKELGCITLSPENQSEIHLSNFLVGYEGKLYEILTDFQMNEIPKYDAIGSGSPFAFSALYTIRKTKLNPEQRIKIALQAAVEFDAYTAPPFIIEKL